MGLFVGWSGFKPGLGQGLVSQMLTGMVLGNKGWLGLCLLHRVKLLSVSYLLIPGDGELEPTKHKVAHAEWMSASKENEGGKKRRQH